MPKAIFLRLLALVLLLNFGSTLSAQAEAFFVLPATSPYPPHQQFQPLIPIAEGTGQSSGKVVELDLYNPTGRTVTREIGPFVTTAREGRQAYVINNTYRVEVPPQSRVSLDLYGYCLHRRQDPVPQGENLPDPNRWATPQTAPPAPTPGSPLSGNFKPRPVAGELQPTYPGTRTPFPYTAKLEEDLPRLSNYLIDATDRLEEAYDELSRSGRIPPVLDNPETQRSTFVQQALWQLTGLLDGDSSYTYEDFKIQYTEAVEEEENRPVSALNKEAGKSVERTAENIFSYVQLVGLEAKVLTRPEEAEAPDAWGYWQEQIRDLPVYGAEAQERCLQLQRQLQATGTELSSSQKQVLQESLHEKFIDITTAAIEAIDCPEAGSCPDLSEQEDLLNASIVTAHLPPAALDELQAALADKAAAIQNSSVAALAPDITGFDARLAGLVNLPTDELPPEATDKLQALVSDFAQNRVPAIDLAGPTAGGALVNGLDVLQSPFAVENLDPALRRPAVDQLQDQLGRWTTAQAERLGMTIPLDEENLLGQLGWTGFVSPWLDQPTLDQVTEALSNRTAQWMSGRISAIRPGSPGALPGLIDQADLLNNEFLGLLSSAQREQVAELLTDGFSQHFLRTAEGLNPYDSDFLRDWRHLQMDVELDYFRAYVPQSTRTEVRNLLQQRAQQLAGATTSLTPADLNLERVALSGRLWKETSPPVATFAEKGPFPWWWIAVPAAGITTYLIITGGGEEGEEPQPPIAVDDRLTVTCAQTTTLNVLANDSGEGLSVTSVSQPAGAVVTILTGGMLQISEIGNADFSFTYIITDQNGLTDVATVTVTVLLPEFSPMDDTFTGESGSPLSGNVLGNDLGNDLTVTGNSSPAGGALTLDMDGNFNFQPENDFCSTTSFTYTVEDVCAQSGEATVNITIQDVTDPQIECPPDIVIACDQDPNDLELTGEPTTTDNCAGEINLFFTDEISGDGCNQQIDRSWLAQDEAGNETSCVQVIQQIDDIAPSITCPDDVTLECDTDLTDPAITGDATAEDNCSAQITLTFEDDESGLTGCSGTGELIRSWTATDECGNESSCEQIITLVDETAPVITCPPEITVNCGQQEDLSITGQADATDNCSGNVDITYTDDLGGFSGCEGVIIRNWSATDECGNTVSCEQPIVVAPVVCDFEPAFDIVPADCGMLNGQISVEVFPPTGNYALEWSSGAVGNNLFELPAGSYEVTITDLNANCAQVFPIFVEEIPPEYVIEVITLPASCNQSGEIVLDLDGNGPFTVIITGPENETIPDLPAGIVNLGDLLFLPEGEYFIEVIDQSANPNCIDLVNVEVTYVPAIELLVESVVNPSSPGAADGSVTLFVPTPGIEFPLQVLLNGIPVGTANGPLFQITNLPAGAYDIQVIDANGAGCPSNVVTVTLVAPMFGPEVYWPGGLYQDPGLRQAATLLDGPLQEAAEEWLEEGPIELPPERWRLISAHELRPAVSLTLGGPLRGNWQWRWTGGRQEGQSLGYIPEIPGTTLSAGFESWFQNGNLRYLPREQKLAPFIGGGVLWQQVEQEAVFIDGFGPGRQSETSFRDDHWQVYLQAGYRWQPSEYLQVELEGRWGGKAQLYLIPRVWVKF